MYKIYSLKTEKPISSQLKEVGFFCYTYLIKGRMPCGILSSLLRIYRNIQIKDSVNEFVY
jgi:hypothetical protein